MKQLRLLCAAALTSAFLLTGCGTTTPVVNPGQQYAPTQVNAKQMHEAIVMAAHQRKWRILSDKPGEMLLAYPGSAKAVKFEARVKVDYTAKDYQVSYVSSRGLDERKGCVNTKATGDKRFDENVLCVHRNVNRWMNNLSADIMDNLYRRPF